MKFLDFILWFLLWLFYLVSFVSFFFKDLFTTLCYCLLVFFWYLFYVHWLWCFTLVHLDFTACYMLALLDSSFSDERITQLFLIYWITLRLLLLDIIMKYLSKLFRLFDFLLDDGNSWWKQFTNIIGCSSLFFLEIGNFTFQLIQCIFNIFNCLQRFNILTLSFFFHF